jgi:PAS domain S-box-containing protein
MDGIRENNAIQSGMPFRLETLSIGTLFWQTPASTRRQERIMSLPPSPENKGFTESDDEFRHRIFESSCVPIVVLDVVTGRYVDCTEAAAILLGFRSRQDAIGASPIDISAPVQYNGAPSGEMVRHHDAQALASGSAEFEWRCRRPDGECWDAQIHLMSFSSDGRQYLQFTIRDITQQKRMEDELKSSRANLAALIASTNDPIWSVDADYRLLTCNQALADHLRKNRSIEARPGVVLHELFPEPLQQTWLAFYQRTQSEGPFCAEYLLPDGRMLELSFNPILQDGQFAGISIFGKNVTEHKRSDEALQASVNRGLRQRAAVAELVLNNTDGENTLSGALNQVTRKLAETLGVARASIWMLSKDGSELNCLDLYIADTGSHTAGLTLKTAEFPAYFQAIRAESRVVANDALKDPRTKSIVPAYLQPLGISSLMDASVQADGKLIGIVCAEHIGPMRSWHPDEEVFASTIAAIVAQILTDARRRHMETALRQSEERLRRLIERAPVAIVICRSDKILYVNQRLLATFGFQSTDELTGQSIFDRLAPESRDLVEQYSRRREMGETVPSEYEVTCHRKDGSRFPVSIAVEAIELPDGLAIIAFLHDITERKHMEEQLRQSQKMEAIGQLAGGVAHDFNNILMAILLHLNLLQDDEKLDPAVQTELKELEAEAHRAAALTRQLLMFSRRQVMKPQVFEFNSLLGSLLKMLRRLIGENINLEFSGAARSFWIEADPGMIEQAVMNLVVNARDAMPKGGRVTLHTGCAELDETTAARHPESRPGRFVCLQVSDTGCGMDAETMRHIFEPFFTTKAPGKGTGLGLATVYGIVKQHQGWVELQSTVGQGTTFSIFLPLCEQPENPETTGAQPTVLPRGSETLLFVEDDHSVRNTVTRMLRRLGYRVIEAGDASEAARLWSLHMNDIALLLTDMVMPGDANGLDLARQMLDQKPALKVILTSGYSAEIAQWGIPKDARIRFLPKPLNAPILAQAVRDSL